MCVIIRDLGFPDGNFNPSTRTSIPSAPSAELTLNKDKRKINDDGRSFNWNSFYFFFFGIFISLLILQLGLQFSVEDLTFPRNTSFIAEEAEEIADEMHLIHGCCGTAWGPRAPKIVFS